jgi:hypothetical protein
MTDTLEPVAAAHEEDLDQEQLAQQLLAQAKEQGVSAYDLTCRLKYDLTCRSRHCDHGMGSPPATRVSRSLRR